MVHPMKQFASLTRRSPIGLIASLAVVLVAGGSGLAADPAGSPAPELVPPNASPAIASRGTHCIECYLFWDPTADARAVLDVPITVVGPAWLALDLPATDGTTIRLTDFAGHPVLVELMATWCASCADQQDVLKAVHEDLPADTVIVSVDVDVAGDVGGLASYATAHGYDWVFAVGSRDLLRGLVDAFGADAINPAATPIVVIDRDGTASLPELGHKDAPRISDLLART
jgi:thiol-disulfide isomerase/thioredoxin